MPRIGMEFAEIRAVASQYGKYSTDIEQLIKSLRSSQQQLSTHWEGRGFTQFQVRFDELVPNVLVFQQLLEEIQQFLAQSANLLEEVDQQIAAGAGK